ncbi:MAG: glycosyl transferase family 28 [Rhodovulum sulfidophilum]|uniref:Glycosyl transferase family 28 n=1 Tax=Rhodovulum sulfidophilum TaxID=35806 RepID=A0A2W5NB12_RHOSU|nr:MAG: glycosyl transferase family 28 [Rhodovulum sulfidophilum]
MRDFIHHDRPERAFREARPFREPDAPARIALYSHDTLGFGHWRRNLLLAAALRRLDPAPEVLLIAGMREAGAFDLPDGVDTVTLPAYGKDASGAYRARSLGLALPELAALRATTIRAALESYDPDILIVDNVPRGAQGELDPALAALRARGRARIVLGLRDVIDSAEVVRGQWLRARNFPALRRWFDEVWIYGDPNFYDLVSEYGFGPEFAARARFMGYLDQRERLPDLRVPGEAPYVLCAVGGGRDGARLCSAFAEARLPAGHRGILIAGSQMPAPDRAALRARIAARDDMEMLDFVSEPLRLVAGAARMVAMGGYNTVTEVLSFGVPALILPRTRPRREQILRAERLAAAGLVGMIEPDDLTADRLSDWLHGPPPRVDRARDLLDMAGLGAVRARVADLLSPARKRACA